MKTKHHHLSSLLLCLLGLIPGMAFAEADLLPKPGEITAKWIWGPNPKTAKVKLRKQVKLASKPAFASFLATCDNAFFLRINGKNVTSSKDWTKPVYQQTASFFKKGDNLIEVDAEMHGGASGFVAQFIIGKDKTLVETDKSWQVSLGEKWNPATEVHPYGKGLWGRVLDKASESRTGSSPHGAPNRSPELSKVDETHTKQFNDLLAAIHVYDPSKEQVEALLRKIGITWGHGCELSLLSLPEKHRKGHGVELRAIAKMLGLTPEEQAAAKKPRGNEPQRPATGAPDSDIAKLHARIDKNPLPKGYQGNRHQPYVDRVMAGLKPEQRVRVGQLWKEKRRLDSDMPNPGASFVRILTHVAEEAGKSKQPTNAPFTNKPVTPPSTTTQPKKPPASTNDHGTFCACKDCRKKKKGGSLFPDVENRP